MILQVLSNGPGELAKFTSTLTMSRGGRETLVCSICCRGKGFEKSGTVPVALDPRGRSMMLRHVLTSMGEFSLHPKRKQNYSSGQVQDQELWGQGATFVMKREGGKIY